MPQLAKALTIIKDGAGRNVCALKWRQALLVRVVKLIVR